LNRPGQDQRREIAGRALRQRGHRPRPPSTTCFHQAAAAPDPAPQPFGLRLSTTALVQALRAEPAVYVSGWQAAQLTSRWRRRPARGLASHPRGLTPATWTQHGGSAAKSAAENPDAATRPVVPPDHEVVPERSRWTPAAHRSLVTSSYVYVGRWTRPGPGRPPPGRRQSDGVAHATSAQPYRATITSRAVPGRARRRGSLGRPRDALRGEHDPTTNFHRVFSGTRAERPPATRESRSTATTPRPTPACRPIHRGAPTLVLVWRERDPE